MSQSNQITLQNINLKISQRWSSAICYIDLLHIFEPSQKVTCERYEQMLDHQRRQNQKSGRPDQGVVINIECDAECHVQERNRKIAEALEIDQPTISSELDVIYPESVIRFAQG